MDHVSATTTRAGRQLCKQPASKTSSHEDTQGDAGRQPQARSHASRQLASRQAGRQGECWQNPIKFLAISWYNPSNILGKNLRKSWQDSGKMVGKSWQNPAGSWKKPGNILPKSGRKGAKSWKNPGRQAGTYASRMAGHHVRNHHGLPRWLKNSCMLMRFLACHFR